jgi:hypothetical protein
MSRRRSISVTVALAAFATGMTQGIAALAGYAVGLAARIFTVAVVVASASGVAMLPAISELLKKNGTGELFG